MEIGGENLLVPSDFNLDDEILKVAANLSEPQIQSLVRLVAPPAACPPPAPAAAAGGPRSS